MDTKIFYNAERAVCAALNLAGKKNSPWELVYLPEAGKLADAPCDEEFAAKVGKAKLAGEIPAYRVASGNAVYGIFAFWVFEEN